MASLSDWVGTGTGSDGRDIVSTPVKEGTGSLRFRNVASNDSGIWLTRDVTDPQMRTTLWARTSNREGVGPNFLVNHNKYGSLDIFPSVLSGVFRQFRCTFWYDKPNDTKWGRREFRDLVTDDFTEIGTPSNFGAGEPVAGKIRLGGNFPSQNFFIDDQVVLDAVL